MTPRGGWVVAGHTSGHVAGIGAITATFPDRAPSSEPVITTRPTSVSFTTTAPIRREAVEVLTDTCTVCRHRLRRCACHDRGYN